MKAQNYMKIGRLHCWMENGNLRLYCHEVGDPTGFSCTLDATETSGLLELLSRHYEEINNALAASEHQRVTQRELVASI